MTEEEYLIELEKKIEEKVKGMTREQRRMELSFMLSQEIHGLSSLIKR